MGFQEGRAMLLDQLCGTFILGILYSLKRLHEERGIKQALPVSPFLLWLARGLLLISTWAGQKAQDYCYCWFSLSSGFAALGLKSAEFQLQLVSAADGNLAFWSEVQSAAGKLPAPSFHLFSSTESLQRAAAAGWAEIRSLFVSVLKSEKP